MATEPSAVFKPAAPGGSQGEGRRQANSKRLSILQFLPQPETHVSWGHSSRRHTHTHTHTHTRAPTQTLSRLRNPTQTAGSSGYLSLVCYLPTRHLTCPKALPNRVCVQASSAQTLPLPLCQADHEGTVRKAPAGTAAAGRGEAYGARSCPRLV